MTYTPAILRVALLTRYRDASWGGKGRERFDLARLATDSKIPDWRLSRLLAPGATVEPSLAEAVTLCRLAGITVEDVVLNAPAGEGGQDA